MKIKVRCENCKKEQKRDVSLSTEDWEYFNTAAKCECGGNFEPTLDSEV